MAPYLTQQQALNKLRRLMRASELPRIVFANIAMGRSVRTLARWFAGDTIPGSSLRWIHAVESVKRTPTGRLIITTAPNVEVYANDQYDT